MLNPVVGEANCMSDRIEVACLLGTAGYTSYFEDAEWMLRNHLLVSQMDDLSWVTKNEEMTNTEIHAYDNLRRRVSGAFCFGEPNGFHSYNSDLTGVGDRESQLPDNISLPMMEKGTYASIYFYSEITTWFASAARYLHPRRNPRLVRLEN